MRALIVDALHTHLLILIAGVDFETDFERRLILIRESSTWSELGYTKNDASQRDVQMSGSVIRSAGVTICSDRESIDRTMSKKACDRVEH